MSTPEGRARTEAAFKSVLGQSAAAYERAGRHLNMVAELFESAPADGDEILSRAILNALEVYRTINLEHRRLNNALLQCADRADTPHAVIADVMGVPESVVEAFFAKVDERKKTTPD